MSADIAPTGRAGQPPSGGAPSPDRSGSASRVRASALARNPILISAVIAVLLLSVGQVVSPGFGAPGQVISMLRVASFLGFIAVGQTIVILSGGDGIDLSVGKTATFAAIVAARVMDGSDANVVQGLALALLAGALVGLANGLGITFLRIPPFVMTLGMMGVVQGLILAYTQGVAGGRSAPMLTSLVGGRAFLGVPGVLWIWLAVTVLVVLLLRRTRFGWELYAVGANREAARLSGVPVRRRVIQAYVASGFFAALGGIMLVGYTESVFLNLADSYTLPAVAAVIIGGTLASGGVGGYAGSAVGAIVLTVLTSFLTTINVPEAWRTIINGAVLVILLAAYGRQRRLRQ
ncbi:MAG: ABC transporter permease [Actinomyces sp.]|nr:ABC transporter permease [Actinomyces sp.]MCI1641778.1 ABC transporter permease [Actinomyces sp.]MCI1661594.1 ABC transporter permease [Actinomyces sp.]MCI1690585.1 ABC transporter permease [Actinomyces sp.]MCI1786621.1 ABC transporter permease [Actinomyces sp.]MCI1830685.1 ABC transporter permease [Actinomyces sp.]